MRAIHPAAAVLLLGLLVGCAAEEPPTATPGEIPDPSATATTEAPVNERFAMPAVCLDILPSSRLGQFAADGLVLLGGPDGEYGDEYLLEPSPEQEAGGITCIWGAPDTEISSVTISVAPLSPSTRAAIVSDLADSQGLNESVGEGVTYYWLLGDRDRQPAILNVLTADSWISIIETIGGTDNYTEAEKLAAEVHALVYR